MQSMHENKLHLLDNVLSFLEKLQAISKWKKTKALANVIDDLKCVIQDLEVEDA